MPEQYAQERNEPDGNSSRDGKSISIEISCCYSWRVVTSNILLAYGRICQWPRSRAGRAG